MNEKYIGVDIGATKINAIVFDGEIKKQITQAIESRTGKEKTLNQIKEIIKKLSSFQTDVKGVGIGVPGPLDIEKGRVLNPPNLTGLSGVSLIDEMKKEFNLEILVDNDANCAALGEKLYGAGKDLKDGILVMLTLGSGVGGGIIINNKIYHGATGSAGELGHMAINEKEDLEALASEKFIKQRSDLLPLELEKKARKGDEESKKIYADLGRWLGIGFANIANIFDPDIILIGGGISNADELVLESAKEEMQKRILSPLTKENIKVQKAELGKDAGAIGAASLFL